MDKLIDILLRQGLAGVVIIVLAFVIYKYLLPTIVKVGETNALQAQSLEKIAETMKGINHHVDKEIPEKISQAKDEIIEHINQKIT